MLVPASLVAAALVITIVLQIVLIVLVLGLKKKNEPVIESSASPDQKDFRKPREPENRFTRKPPHDHKMKPAPAQGQNIDQVERSLRDINLRLKNAEKDQEKERRRIKDTISSPPSRRFENHKPRERDDRYRRHDRQRNDYHQNRTNDSSQGFREEKFSSKNNVGSQEKKPAPQFQNPASIAPSAPVASPSDAFVSIPAISSEPIFEPAQELPENKENLQHGRKVAVKRRMLNVEEGQPAESNEGALKEEFVTQASPEQAAMPPKAESEPTKAANPSESSQAENESYASGPISFGR